MAFDYWDKLLYGIRSGECILFLGPELPLETARGERREPAQELADRLHRRFARDGEGEVKAHPQDLMRTAQRFVQHEDEVSLEIEVANWHGDLAGLRSTLHDDLAALPFQRIVTSAHDPLMETALRHAGKQPAIGRYHFRGTSPDLLPEPTVDEPVLYHLYGHAGEPPSVVLAEAHLLDFLVALISRNPPLPNDVNEALTNSRFFLFLGFGLERWYLRILLHVLKVLRRGASSFAVEMPVNGDGQAAEDAILFYRDNYRLAIHHADVSAFVKELRERYQPPPDGESGAGSTGGGPPPGAPTAFICHANEDRERAREVHGLLRRAGVESWLDREALRGGDRWDALIQKTIPGVDYFVVLNSQALLAKPRAIPTSTRRSTRP